MEWANKFGFRFCSKFIGCARFGILAKFLETFLENKIFKFHYGIKKKFPNKSEFFCQKNQIKNLPDKQCQNITKI